MVETTRTFIAIALPEAILKEIFQIYNNLKPLSKAVRWVKPENVHLTLKFLGNLTKEEINEVFDGMEDIFGEKTGYFSLLVRGMGAFPNLQRPKVLWLGVGGAELPTLLQLQSQIDDILYKKGFKRENRKFSPHLTIGRIKSVEGLENFMEQFIKYKFPPQNFIVQNVQVFKSLLKPKGVVYSVQKTYYFRE